MSENGQETGKRTPGSPPQAKNRPARIPMGERGRLCYDKNLLDSLKERGLKPRLFTDSPGRIDAALAAGYQFVNDDGTIGEERAGAASKMGANMTTHVGGGQKGYLMVLPQDWYDEDQHRKQKKVDELEDAMKAPRKGDKLASDAQGSAYGTGLTND